MSINTGEIWQDDGVDGRVGVRTWDEVNGYVEFVYQVYNDSIGKWEDSVVMPSMDKKALESIYQAAKFLMTRMEDEE